MRIRLKVALLDVRTGNWSGFSPKPFAEARLTTSPGRGAVDQKQVEHLKQLAYEARRASFRRTSLPETIAQFPVSPLMKWSLT